MLKNILVLLISMCTIQAVMSAECPKVLNARLNNLNGQSIDFCEYQGKVILAVNTASQCGNTPQYEALESLFQKYAEKGLVVIGFPANNFGDQEPGSNKDIQDFCRLNYGVNFPMVEKTDVVGPNSNPIFSELQSMTGVSPSWNFHKYLISRDGTRAFSFSSSISPMNAKLVKKLEQLLQ
ncbi:MAG: glutathione peroxidase [Proteobacteria bacterium]|nr:glutathione peroxidase [Pseudomonadota bacterium]